MTHSLMNLFCCGSGTFLEITGNLFTYYKNFLNVNHLSKILTCYSAVLITKENVY